MSNEQHFLFKIKGQSINELHYLVNWWHYWGVINGITWLIRRWTDAGVGISILRGGVVFWIQKIDCPRISRFHARQIQSERVDTFSTLFVIQ